MLALLFQKHISSRQCKLVCHHTTKILPLLKLHHRQKAHANPKNENETADDCRRQRKETPHNSRLRIFRDVDERFLFTRVNKNEY